MTPKFEVGEVVLLRSVEIPEANGEYTVISIYPEGRAVTPHGNYIVHKSFGYFLTDNTNTDSISHTKPLWAESALRKKHIPGELSFTDLMASISPSKALSHS